MNMRRINSWLLLAILSGVFCPVIGLPAAMAAPGEQTAVRFEGGAGDSIEQAVIIRGAPDGVAGVAAEYRYLREKFGQQNRDWQLTRQEVLQNGGRVFDVMLLKLADGRQLTVYFDITEFFGRQ
jgi:hypothetical protein